MKSMLQEASSVAKAIDQAWQESGKPKEFSLRVLQEPVKNFFGFVKKPAIVSIIYDPRKHTTSSQGAKGRTAEHTKHKQQSRSPRKEQGAHRSKEQQSWSSNEVQEAKKPVEERSVWTDSYIELIGDWLRGMLKEMNVAAKFGIALERGLLKIQFDKPVLASEESERILFASFVSLLLQFLRRHEKKKLRGLRLVIVSRR